MLDLALQLNTAITAAREACAVCRRVQRDLDSVRAIAKDDKSPVTVADFASQAVVARRLRDDLGAGTSLRSLRLIAEENSAVLRRADHASYRAAALEAVRAVWPDASEDDALDAIDLGAPSAPGQPIAEPFWTLDPIDGTKGFLRGEQYAVSLALIQDGQPVVGVLGCPNLSADVDRPFDDPDPHGLIFYAVAGGGLFCAPADDAAVRPTKIELPTRDPSAPVRACESVESGHTSQGDSARVLASLGAMGAPSRLDSQCKYAVVARGQADVYLRLPTRKGYVEKIWDHAAGELVAREAGRVVTDIAGVALDFSQGCQLEKNRGIVCADPSIHAAIIRAIDELAVGAGA